MMKHDYPVRLISLLLVLLTFTASLFSCAPGGENPSDTLPATKAEETEARITADLPDLDLGGYTFSVYHWVLNGGGVLYNDLYAEELDGDPVNEAIFRRNSRLGEKYHFDISYTDDEYNVIVQNVRSLVRAGDDVYDLVYIRLNDVQANVLEGDFLDFETSFRYVDLDKPYWDQSLRETLSFMDHLFLAASAINTEDKKETVGMMFNKQIAADHNMPDFYDLVNKGEWTLDKLYDIVNTFDGDLNGDSVLRPGDDILPCVSNDFAVMSLFFGAGGHFVTKDKYGVPEYTFNTEENYEITELVTDIMTHPNYASTDTTQFPADMGGSVGNFESGESLFLSYALWAVIEMRGIDTIDFGVIPHPKYDEAQTDYISYLSKHGMGFMSVLRCEEDTDNVGFIMEALAADSYYDLQDAFYDVTLKTKSARDDESQAMLDLIFSNRVIDFADVYDFSGFASAYLRQLSNPGFKNKNITTIYAEYEKKIESTMEDFYEKVEKLDEEIFMVD